MGSLREALRCLCVEIGWSYAVFWRPVGSESPMHLVCEDGHVVDNKAEVLVNKIMAQQVHVVGEGIVGQAAGSGLHQWIFTEKVCVKGSCDKGLGELNQQHLAGIQTIAVIPVLYRGVLQLGSVQMIMENINFINHVQSLFAGLECARGAFLPVMPLKGSNQDNQVCDGVPVMASEMLPDKSMIPRSVAFLGALQPLVHMECQPNINSQLENRPAMFDGILHNIDMRFFQPASSHDSASKFNDKFSIVGSELSSSSLQSCEQHLAKCNIKSSESAKRTVSGSDNARAFTSRSHTLMLPNSAKESNIISFPQRIDSIDGVNAFGNTTRSVPDGTTETTRIPCTNFSDMESVQMLSQRIHSGGSCEIPVGPFLTHLYSNTSESLPTAVSQKQENYLIEASHVPSCKSDGNGLCEQVLVSTLQEFKSSTSNVCLENHKYKSDSCNVDCSVIPEIKPNIMDNDDSKFRHAFHMQSTSENDLYDILGPDYKVKGFTSGHNAAGGNNIEAREHKLAADSCTGIADLDVCSVTDSLIASTSGPGMISADANQLLDVVISKLNSSDDGESCKTSITSTSSSTVPVISPHYELQSSSEQMKGKSSSFLPLIGKAQGLASTSDYPAFSLGYKNEDGSQDAGIYRSQIGLWVETSQSTHIDSTSTAHNKTSDDTGKSNRKRARPGENPRPRPKDRQMIMDRVKELREIIPNGAKCSIDALLEKTIKHMLFLQSVTKHADNLKDIGEPKFIDKEGGISLKEKFEGGAPWPAHAASQSMACPIIVEDLKPPRQMLVEMLCEQRGFFLEIADLIRGLGLTILKGVMEAHKDKIWARFAVEANRDVNRVEIFVSLVRLLESTVGCSTVAKGVDNVNLPHHMYHHSCVAASGTSSHLL